MPLNEQSQETGWISKEAFRVGALSADAVGRQAVADGFITPQMLGDDAVTPVKTSGVCVPNVLGAPSVEAGAVNDVLAAVDLPAAATTEVMAALALPAAATNEILTEVALPAATTDEVHAPIEMPAADTTVVNTGITNPPTPREVAIIGNAAGISGNVIIDGTDNEDAPAQDTIAANGTTKVYGTVVFKTVTQITVPARNAEGDTIAVGLGRDITIGLSNPATPRVLAIKGNQAGVAGNVTITGTDEADQAANEVIVASGTDKVYGTQIFKTVTLVTLPALVGAGDKIAVGLGREITFGLTNPDVPRVLAILGSQAGVAGNVTIEGTDDADEAASEVIVAVDDTKVYGTQIFKTVTKVTLPALVGGGDTIAVGIGRDITVGITDPDICRTVAVKGNQAGVTGDVVITGTNYLDAAITETIVASDDTTVYGAKAFKTVSSIRVPALAGAGDTIAVGRGKALGLHQVLAAAGQVLFCTLDRAIQAPTVAVDADEIEKNTVDLSAGTYDGSKVAVAMIYR